ncbi:MAG: hypothetical protein HOM68_04210 [Gemmatimonadetes bacterium]|mgnify:FL=1|jgi:Spy/CpxP family protein refolding chaperone|nr:hypothetical protein [Gemmatimonadota bacterium]MBT5143886.1 hypothetical protein [Gemmatimonadota bacterium]MBT5589066.1 hypothetical protein [Gemmatimonadota bacterium]MBT5962952.1 hypothetical protein [Gemmatimonadota bacterium]MBT7456872.1 hypothetical protein [Gemmatimonadota bacterium]
MKRLTLFALAALATTITFTDAQAQGGGPDGPPAIDENADGIADGRARTHRGRGHRGARGTGPVGELLGDLTDAQKAELQALRESLRESDVTREAAHASMQEKLAEFGVELPSIEEIQVEREAARTEHQAQREAVRNLVEGLKAEGATREEIREALTDAGYEPPARGRRGRGARGPRGSTPPVDAAEGDE